MNLFEVAGLRDFQIKQMKNWVFNISPFLSDKLETAFEIVEINEEQTILFPWKTCLFLFSYNPCSLFSVQIVRDDVGSLEFDRATPSAIVKLLIRKMMGPESGISSHSSTVDIFHRPTESLETEYLSDNLKLSSANLWNVLIN